MVKRAERGREESDLDRIQDLFANDPLHLHEKDPLVPQRKGLSRSKSTAALKIQKALPGKTRSNEDMPCNYSRSELFHKKQHLWGDDNFRVFIMESPVHFVRSMQKQERHLFLFNDLLVVGKPKSGGSYKLKEMVRLNELWLSQCVTEVFDGTGCPATAFVIGWPTTNVMVSFNSLKTKDLWQQKFIQLIEECKDKERDQLTAIQILFKREDIDEEYCKTIQIDNKVSAQECINIFLQQIGYSDNEIEDYRLWVKSRGDSPPYPLIGHEYPYNIKMNFIRSVLQRSELDFGQNLNNISTDSKCYFLLRKNPRKSGNNNKTPVYNISDMVKCKKARRIDPPRFVWPFNRKAASKHDSVDSGNSSPPPQNLFGIPLWKLSPDSVFPKSIMSMLVQLLLQGPYTQGIFRKSANARVCRELKEKLEANPELDIRNVSVLILASVFKDFLRSLPDCLLQSDLYKYWLQSVAYDDWECKKRIVSLLNQIPTQNIRFLQYTLCMLWHISQNASENQMTSSNLAVCIGPSLLNAGKFPASLQQQGDAAEKVPKFIAFLIDHCADIFGDEVLHLLGSTADRDRQDSGAEESDSLHSLHDTTAGQYRRDDSSIDSLDRDFLDDTEPSPKLPCKTKMSLTNLSRDSGLTLSDTQLYTPDEDPDSDPEHRRYANFTKSVSHLDTAGVEHSNKSNSFLLEQPVPSSHHHHHQQCGRGGGGDCSTVSYGRSVGVSIDGSCNDVVRKRRMEAQRTRSHAAAGQNEFHGGYEGHLPLQMSQSYSYSMQQDLMQSDGFVRNYHAPVRRRDVKGRSALHRPVVSAVEPLSEYGDGTLRRSASEESLMQKYIGSAPATSQGKRRAPSPPNQKASVSAPCSAKKELGSRPDWKWCARQSQKRTDWKRSQSASKIDELEQDSSTLSLVSSEDSTPHVSRSSSRVQELAAKSQSDLYDIYCSPQRVNSICSSNSEGSHQSHCSQASGKSQRSNNGSIGPPSYQEAISRQTMLKQHMHPSVTEEMRAEQTSLSARARELYENSVRIYSQQKTTDDTTHRALPADVVDGRCSRRDSSERMSRLDAHRSPAARPELRVKSCATRAAQPESPPSCRLRHLPPVHVTDAQLHTLRNFHIRAATRDPVPAELRNEISWSVAELRERFDGARRRGRRGAAQAHARSRSLSSRGEEESFV